MCRMVGEIIGPDIVILGVLALVVAVPVVLVVLLVAKSQQGSVSPSTSAVPPQWGRDPYGRHEYRYFDGNRWTAQVSDGGIAGVDAPSG